MGKWGPYLFFVGAALLFPWTIYGIFLSVPLEQTMGTAFKIFFFHVPMAWVMMLMAMVSGISAAIFLRNSSPRADGVALAAAELGFVFGVGVLVSGPIWGNATWGKPWTGDARQLSTALLWLVLAAYLLLRRYGPPQSQRLAAALAVFSAIEVPLIYYAVKIWKTEHPDTTVVGELPTSMGSALWPAVACLLLFSFGLLAIRIRQHMLEHELDKAWIRVADRQSQGVS